MISFFSDTFLENHFIITAMIHIKFLFGAYKGMDILKYLQKIAMQRVQVFGAQVDLKKGIDKLIKEKDKLQNIDELIKYIEGDKSEKKKKKKKNIIISLDDLKIGEKKHNDDFIDDGVSIMSEPDSVVEAFKNEIINDTILTNALNLKPALSQSFFGLFK